MKSLTSINEVIGCLTIYTNGQKENKTNKQKPGCFGFVDVVAFEPGVEGQEGWGIEEARIAKDKK